ncbi:hypothetical protein ACFX2I_020084 [Malus domestica]
MGKTFPKVLKKIEEAPAFPDLLAPVTRKLSFAEITGNLSKRRSQKSKRPLLFQTCQHLSHANSALQKLRAICRSADLRNRRGACFSRLVSTCHMQTQLSENYGQFVEASISEIEEAPAFPDLSAPVTCTLSFAEITGNLSKISDEVENETRRNRVISQHLVSIFRSGTDCLELLPDCLPTIALEYSSSTADVLPNKLPHLPREQIRQVKMIP